MNEQPSAPGQNTDSEKQPNPTVPAGPSQPALGQGKRKSMMFAVTGVILLAVLGGAYFWFTKDTAPVVKNHTIKIGFIAPFSGDDTSHGKDMTQGLELAVKEFNQEGTTIQIIKKDTDCDGEKAAAATKQLVDKDKVVAIIGESCSSATLGAAPIAEAGHVVMISPSSTSPAITKAGDYIFRTIPSDALQAVVAAKLIHDKGLSRLAILYANDAYGVGLSTAAKNNFEKLGGKVVATETIEKDTTNVDEQLKRITAASPDAVYIITSSLDVASAALIRAQALGIKAQMFGSEALRDDSILADAAGAAENLTVTAPVSKDSGSFFDKFRTTYGAAPNGGDPARVYDCFNAIAKALKQGATTGEEIKNALAKVSFEGASGKIQFDSNGDIIGGTYNSYVVKDRKFTLIK